MQWAFIAEIQGMLDLRITFVHQIEVCDSARHSWKQAGGAAVWWLCGRQNCAGREWSAANAKADLDRAGRTETMESGEESLLRAQHPVKTKWGTFTGREDMTR